MTMTEKKIKKSLINCVEILEYMNVVTAPESKKYRKRIELGDTTSYIEITELLEKFGKDVKKFVKRKI